MTFSFRQTKSQHARRRALPRIAVGILSALLFTIVLTGCGAADREAKTYGTETEPLYGGEFFVSSETISFESGESMRCFGQKSTIRESAIFCDWDKAPLANLKLSEESAKGWDLVFLDLNRGTIVCIASDFVNNPDKMSCRQSPILR